MTTATMLHDNEAMHDMRTLYLLRHAKSDWSGPGLDDFDRPLAPRGKRACRLVADHLAKTDFLPDLVLCSRALRARQTLLRIENAFAEDYRVSFEQGLYLASAEDLMSRLRRLPPALRRVLLIGHNPGLEDLAARLCGPVHSRGTDMPGSDLPDQMRFAFPTATLAVIELSGDDWAHIGLGTGRLASLTLPRSLEASQS